MIIWGSTYDKSVDPAVETQNLIDELHNREQELTDDDFALYERESSRLLQTDYEGQIDICDAIISGEILL